MVNPNRLTCNAVLACVRTGMHRCRVKLRRDLERRGRMKRIQTLLSRVGRISKNSNGASGSIGGFLISRIFLKRGLRRPSSSSAAAVKSELNADRINMTPATKPMSRPSIKATNQGGSEPWMAKGTATAATRTLSANGSKMLPSADCWPNASTQEIKIKKKREA